MAAGILLTAGEDRNEWLVNAGVDFNNRHRMIFSVGQLRQKLDFGFIAGTEKTQITQDNLAASYQYLLGKDWLNAAELNAYVGDAESVKLSDKTYYTDTSTLYELWRDPRRIAGSRLIGLQGRLVVTPTDRTKVTLGLGAERLTYDYLIGDESTHRATGSAELVHRLESGFNLRASANTAASQNTYGLGLGRSFEGGSQLGLDLTAVQGRDGVFNDERLQLTYTQSFGGGQVSSAVSGPLQMADSGMNQWGSAGTSVNAAPIPTATSSVASTSPVSRPWTSSLVEQVSRRPSFLPSQVMTKIDPTATPTRLIAVDKTAVTTGTTVDRTSGIITAPTKTDANSVAVDVSQIIGVTKNAVTFSNTGQFTIGSDNKSLIINPNLITQPAVGVIDTYVVTMSNTSGGGTTLATINVSHGSTKIDSIVISSGIITPTLSGFGLSRSSAVVNTLSAVTITAPTSASIGDITYSSSNTAVATIGSMSGVITIAGIGTTTFTATQAANGNYASSTATRSLTVTAASIATLVSGGLTWTKNNATAPSGIVYTDNNTVKTAPSGSVPNLTTANATCAALTEDGFTWRLPTRDELYYLNDVLTGWTLNWTWTSTPESGNRTKVVNLSSPHADGTNDSSGSRPDYVTCVHR
jgi:hypothetical protein